MSEQGLGIQGAVQRLASQSVQADLPAVDTQPSDVPMTPIAAAAKAAATLPGQSTTQFTRDPLQPQGATLQDVALQQAALQSPALARVPLPPRGEGEVVVRPRKSPAPMAPARDLAGGTSPLAPTPLADARMATAMLGTVGDPSGPSTAAQAGESAAALPTRHGLVAFARNPRGDTVYLENERWEGHIRPAHITDEPAARGKRTTTWWPVQYAASGSPSMTEQNVVGVVMDAVRDGHWQNAPRGTLLSVYDLPEDQAQHYGVSEVKVSAAPDGRILSAYPSRGTNVLAVRELSAEEQTQLQQMQPPVAAADDGDQRMFRTNIAATTFG